MQLGTGGRGAAGGPWTVRAGRVLLAAVAVGGAWVASAGTAGAESCPVFGFVSCPAPTPSPSPAPPAPGPTTTTTTAAPSTTTTVAPESTSQATAHLASLINRERVGRGLQALELRGDVAAIAADWSGTMANAGRLYHDDAYFTRTSHDRLDAALLGENVGRAGGIDEVHRAFMASEHHRDNILDARFTVVGLGVSQRDGTWWVTEDFLQPKAAGAVAATPAPRRSRPRTTRVAGVGVPTEAGAVMSAPAVVGVSAASPRPAAVLPRRDEYPFGGALAGEELVPKGIETAVVVVAALLSLLALIVRRACRRQEELVTPIGELGPAPSGAGDGDLTVVYDLSEVLVTA